MKRAGIRDVAREAGVSITTVSKALNEYSDVNPETKKRIEAVAKRLEYVPNAAGRSMGGKTDKVIGLLINELLPIDPSGAVYCILSGVYHACQDNGVEFILMATNQKMQLTTPLKMFCLKKQLTGLVCCGFHTDDPYIKQLEALDIPCSTIDIRTDAPHVTEITMDNERAACEAVEFLIKNGKQNIALINGSSRADVSILRQNGYCQALSAAGMKLCPERMLNAEFDRDIACQKVKELLSSDTKIDALFCASDLMAWGACDAIESIGLKVGSDIAVIGFDDIPVAKYLYGGLTTIRQDFYLMGYMAGKTVYAQIAGIEPPSTNEMMYELVVRCSATGRL